MYILAHIRRANPSGLGKRRLPRMLFLSYPAVYSRNVKRLVCSMFMALVASYAAMTQDMLISLAPSSHVSVLTILEGGTLTLGYHLNINIVLAKC